MKFKKSFLFFSLFFSSTFIYSQDLAPGFKIWNSAGIDCELNNKLSFKYGHLLGMNANPFGIQFTQLDAEFLYKKGEHFTIGMGYKASYLKTSSSYTKYNRLYNELIFRHKLFKLPIKHSITSEFYFPRLPKYRYRFIYSFNYYFKNDFLPLKITPYIKGELQYYLGGAPISYYNADSLLIVKQSPNDFHRFRLSVGVTSKPFPNMRATFYYMYQQEFNTNLTQNRGINVLSKDKTYFKQPFNNYHVIGLELEFDIKRRN